MAEKTNPFTFLQEVRAEAAKIVWPSRRETLITTAMVFVFVIVASMVFLLADQLIGWAISLVVGGSSG